ncbi:MAG: hypothetical protein J6X22_08005 [Muribaculaceae bacterium]|nr:hypothetical protein [Muribaculaceae bacterium]
MRRKISTGHEMMAVINELGFLPLLDGGVAGFSAEEMVDPECRYVATADGWDWPLWKWKGPIITEGNCVYGKFFAGKAGFVSKQWWPDWCNWRRSTKPAPAAGSIEETILFTLQEHGSLITRELRALCGFSGGKMRSRFDSYVTRLQMQCRIITEDFIYPRDRHGREYGWGWSLLTTPERLLGKELCECNNTPEQSRTLVAEHLHHILPNASKAQIDRIIG